MVTLAHDARTAETTKIIKASRETLARTLAGRYHLTAAEADRIIRAWVGNDDTPAERRPTRHG